MLILQGFAKMAPAIFWALSAGVFLTFGDLVYRFYSQTSSLFAVAGVFTLYVCGNFFMVLSFFGNNIAAFTVMAILFNIISYLLAAYFLFGDMINLREAAGIALGIASIIVLEGLK